MHRLIAEGVVLEVELGGDALGSVEKAVPARSTSDRCTYPG
ncbi:hypothetical protein [Amycolatopsis thermoflava]